MAMPPAKKLVRDLIQNEPWGFWEYDPKWNKVTYARNGLKATIKIHADYVDEIGSLIVLLEIPGVPELSYWAPFFGPERRLRRWCIRRHDAAQRKLEQKALEALGTTLPW